MAKYDPSDLANRLERAAADFVAYIESLDDSQWSSKTEVEGWPVGVAAHHVAVGAQFCSDLAVHVAEGGGITWTIDFVDQVNATHAETFAAISRDEALSALKEQLPAAVEKVKTLTADQLERDLGRTHDFGEGPVRFAGDVVERMVIGHTLQHLESIKKATSQD